MIGLFIFFAKPSFYRPQKQIDQRVYKELNLIAAEKPNLIRLSTPKISEFVESPLIVQGEARGYWFFEASFPMKLLDGNGREIGASIAQAQSEWMTSEFVPFHSELKFGKPETSIGTLVLEKDNPSGLPENADELRIAVRFKP